MGPLEQVVMLIIAVAIASIVLVALLIWLYLWALRSGRRKEREEAMSDVDYPPDDRYDIP